MNKLKNYPVLYTVFPVLLAVFFFYLPDLKNGFVWDDRYSFFVNPMYRDPANILRAVTGSLVYQENFFRPLPVLSFLVQIHIFEMSAARMHFVSILLHVFNTFLVMQVALALLRRLDRNRVYFSAALIGLVYGMHPVLIEPVSFISSRFDMMMTTFLLLALYADTRIRKQSLRALVVGFLFLLAALSKEMAVGFALALPVWHFFHRYTGKTTWSVFFESAKNRGDLKVYLAVFVAGIVYLVLRYLALGLIYDNSLYADSARFTVSQHLALVGISIFKYLGLLLFPVGKINVAHPLPVQLNLVNYQAVSGYLILVGVPLMARFSKSHSVLIVSGFLVILASLLPVLGIIPLPRNPGMYFAESFLPFPLALFALILARPFYAIVGSLQVSREYLLAARVSLSAWLLLAAFTVWSTIPVWNNNISLWLWAKSANPAILQVSNNLSGAYVVAKRYEDAVKEATRGVNLDAEDDVAWNNLALGLNGIRQYREAELAAKKAIALNPAETRNRITLAKIYYSLKDYKAVISTTEYVLEQKPDDIPSLVLLANVYKDSGQISLARDFMRKAIERLPGGEEQKILKQWLEDLG